MQENIKDIYMLLNDPKTGESMLEISWNGKIYVEEELVAISPKLKNTLSDLRKLTETMQKLEETKH